MQIQNILTIIILTFIFSENGLKDQKEIYDNSTSLISEIKPQLQSQPCFRNLFFRHKKMCLSRGSKIDIYLCTLPFSRSKWCFNQSCTCLKTCSRLAYASSDPCVEIEFSSYMGWYDMVFHSGCGGEGGDPPHKPKIPKSPWEPKIPPR